jgi:hypothetical protein
MRELFNGLPSLFFCGGDRITVLMISSYLTGPALIVGVEGISSSGKGVEGNASDFLLCCFTGEDSRDSGRLRFKAEEFRWEENAELSFCMEGLRARERERVRPFLKASAARRVGVVGVWGGIGRWVVVDEGEGEG